MPRIEIVRLHGWNKTATAVINMCSYYKIIWMHAIVRLS